MDPQAILRENLGPLTEALTAYGNRLGAERDLRDRRAYDRGVVLDNRAYDKTLTADQRAYADKTRGEGWKHEEEVDARRRNENRSDEALKHRTDLVREVTQAFPNEDTAQMSDAQLEARASDAKRHNLNQDLAAKGDGEIRQDASRMGMVGADKANISAVRKFVLDTKTAEFNRAEQAKEKAKGDYQEQELSQPDGAKALQQFQALADRKSQLLKEFVTISMTQPETNRDTAKRIGDLTIRMLAANNPDVLKKLSPQDQALIASGQKPIGLTNSSALQAIAQVNLEAAMQIHSSDIQAGRADAMELRNTNYARKEAIGQSMHEIDQAMDRMATAFPALNKRARIDPAAFDAGPSSGNKGSLPPLPPPGAQISPSATSPAIATASVSPDRVQGVLPWMAGNLTNLGSAVPDMPVASAGASQFSGGLGDVLRGTGRLAKAGSAAIFGGTVPPPAPDQSGGPLGMLTGGAQMAMAPFEAVGGTMQNISTALQGPNPLAGLAVRSMSPEETPEQYQAYLRGLQGNFR